LSNLEIPILYEDNHLLVINKPAGLATMGAEAGESTAVSWAADYIGKKYAKPGKVFVGVVSRLDSFVSGVLVLARTSKAAGRLTEQFRERTTVKRYWACVEGELKQAEWKTLTTHVRKDDAAHRMVVVSPGIVGAQQASLRFRTLAFTKNRSLLEIDLLTGRKHQIRLQLSDLGFPIVGDRKYDARSSFSIGIALHSRELTLMHPTRKEPLVFTAPLPHAWNALPAELRQA
jgi:23S rRNA pseudouridine1911/1915/1917 synthase